MVKTVITGRTSLFAAPIHQVMAGREAHDAAVLAHLAVPGPLSALASAPVLSCLECGCPASATELYLDSPRDGECVDCAADADGVGLISA